MVIIFYKYVDGRLEENDGWHRYDRRLVLDRIGRQNEHVRYKALIRESFDDKCEAWHRLDLSKSKKFKKQPRQLNLFNSETFLVRFIVFLQKSLGNLEQNTSANRRCVFVFGAWQKNHAPIYAPFN